MCANAVDKFDSVADIGTDHALVPSYIIKNNRAKYVIASDISLGPLEQGRKTLEKNGQLDLIGKNIFLIQASGLSSITSDLKIDVAIIAGMGGELIISIIKQDLEIAKSLKKIVLQANTNIARLRRFLYSYNFKIINEEIIKENGKYYEMIEVTYFEKKLEFEESDIIFGPFLSKKKSDVFIEKWSKIYQKNSIIISKVQKDLNTISAIKKENALIEKILEDKNV